MLAPIWSILLQYTDTTIISKRLNSLNRCKIDSLLLTATTATNKTAVSRSIDRRSNYQVL